MAFTLFFFSCSVHGVCGVLLCIERVLTFIIECTHDYMCYIMNVSFCDGRPFVKVKNT